ncbi:MAG: trigger factor [Clostridiales bacterium]|nr:trigger factor [Clostridiales bacterium]
MSLQVENLEKNMAKLTVEVSAEDFNKALTASYKKNRSRFNIPGFRKGKAPQVMVEKYYGVGVLYEDAIQEALDHSYPDAAEESGLEIVSRPEVSIVQAEKGKPFIYTAEVAVKPEVTLGEYKGIEVERARPEVTDEDVDTELKKVQDQNSRLVTVERAVEDGDELTIDFEGFIDGEPFDGGKAEDYSLKIGSHSFIDTFEDQLVGKNAGDEVEVSVTFPEEYHAKELAGKPATFQVTVKEIRTKELPELDDEFAGEVSEFDTLDEYKADIRAKLAEKKQAQATAENEDNVVKKVVENATMDIPEPMIDQQIRSMVNDYSARLQSQGITLDQYMQFTGMTLDTLKEQMHPSAESRIRTRLVLEAVAKAESLEATEEAVNQQITSMATNYKMEADKVREALGEDGLDQIREDIKCQEAIDFLVAEAKLV